MKLQNVTLALFVAGRSAPKLLRNPEVPSKGGKPVLGPNLRMVRSIAQLMSMGHSRSVAQAMQATGHPAAIVQ